VSNLEGSDQVVIYDFKPVIDPQVKQAVLPGGGK